MYELDIEDMGLRLETETLLIYILQMTPDLLQMTPDLLHTP